VPSLALGTSPVTLREMVSAYASIADGGRRREPLIVTRIEDRHGKVLEAFADPEPEPVMREAAAQTLVDALRGAIDRGTGAAIRGRWGISADVAGKTGTTQDNTDAWFILMHPQLVAGARVGFNDNRITHAGRLGPGRARGAAHRGRVLPAGAAGARHRHRRPFCRLAASGGRRTGCLGAGRGRRPVSKPLRSPPPRPVHPPMPAGR
jgi:membrane peptidoglycan carboxypeptidase